MDYQTAADSANQVVASREADYMVTAEARSNGEYVVHLRNRETLEDAYFNDKDALNKYLNEHAS